MSAVRSSLPSKGGTACGLGPVRLVETCVSLHGLVSFEPLLYVRDDRALETHHGVNHLGLERGPLAAVQIAQRRTGRRPPQCRVRPRIRGAVRLPQPPQCPAEGGINLLAPTDQTSVDLFPIAPTQGELDRRIWCVILQMIAKAKPDPLELDDGDVDLSARRGTEMTGRPQRFAARALLKDSR